MEYTVIGDTVNLSARLTAAAGPAEVWVSEATKLACPSLHFEALPEIKVKGKERPVVPWRVSA
jgi:class 3 adenylate cyclase